MAAVRLHVPEPEPMNHDRAGLKPLLQCRQGKSLKETLTLNVSVIQAWWFQLLFSAVNYRALCALAYRENWPRGVKEDLGCGGLSAAHDSILHSSRKGNHMNNIIYIVGLVVVILAVLAFFGLR